MDSRKYRTQRAFVIAVETGSEKRAPVCLATLHELLTPCAIYMSIAKPLTDVSILPKKVFGELQHFLYSVGPLMMCQESLEALNGQGRADWNDMRPSVDVLAKIFESFQTIIVATHPGMKIYVVWWEGDYYITDSE